MPELALTDLQNKHDAAVASNQEGGVVPWKNGEKQSDAVYEVIEGAKYLPQGKGDRQARLGPGQRFHPTEKQVASGSLRGKARELTATEMRGLKASGHKQVGSDIGLRAVKGISDSLKKVALDGGLTEEDFAGVQGANNGQFTRAQIDEMIAQKTKS